MLDVSRIITLAPTPRLAPASDPKDARILAVAEETLADSKADRLLVGNLLKVMNAIRRAAPTEGMEETVWRTLLPTIAQSVSAGAAIPSLLLAFPYKSPNHWGRVLGPHADLAEEIAFNNLGAFCKQIESVYPPGIDFQIVSDGEVYAGIRGVRQEAVALYREEVIRLAQSRGRAIRWIGLADFYPKGLSVDEMRGRLLEEYGPASALVEESIKQDDRKYNGFTQFVAFDLPPDEAARLTEKQIKKKSQGLAREMLRLDMAYNRLVEERLGENNKRFSIHAHPESTIKCGLKNLVTMNQNSTGAPWHNVVVLGPGSRIQIMKKSEAESKGYLVVTKNGLPHHYEAGT